MIGNVYVFNATPNDMTLLLNDHILDALLTGTQETSSYAPASTKAPRNAATGNPGTATFGSQNTLVVSFPDGTSQSYPVNINPDQPQIDSDLQLYIFFNQVVLVMPSGSGSEPGQSVIKGQPPSASDVAAMQEQTQR
jgi:hypothetical protein